MEEIINHRIQDAIEDWNFCQQALIDSYFKEDAIAREVFEAAETDYWVDYNKNNCENLDI